MNIFAKFKEKKADKNGYRTIQFPSDRSLGEVYVLDGTPYADSGDTPKECIRLSLFSVLDQSVFRPIGDARERCSKYTLE